MRGISVTSLSRLVRSAVSGFWASWIKKCIEYIIMNLYYDWWSLNVPLMKCCGNKCNSVIFVSVASSEAQYETNMALWWVQYQFLLHSEKWYCTRCMPFTTYYNDLSISDPCKKEAALIGSNGFWVFVLQYFISIILFSVQFRNDN